MDIFFKLTLFFVSLSLRIGGEEFPDFLHETAVENLTASLSLIVAEGEVLGIV